MQVQENWFCVPENYFLYESVKASNVVHNMAVRSHFLTSDADSTSPQTLFFLVFFQSVFCSLFMTVVKAVPKCDKAEGIVHSESRCSAGLE